MTLSELISIYKSARRKKAGNLRKIGQELVALAIQEGWRFKQYLHSDSWASDIVYRYGKEKNNG